MISNELNRHYNTLPMLRAGNTELVHPQQSLSPREKATNGGRALSCLFSLSWNKPRLRRTMAEVRTSKNVIW